MQAMLEEDAGGGRPGALVDDGVRGLGAAEPTWPDSSAMGGRARFNCEDYRGLRRRRLAKAWQVGGSSTSSSTPPLLLKVSCFAMAGYI